MYIPLLLHFAQLTRIAVNQQARWRRAKLCAKKISNELEEHYTMYICTCIVYTLYSTHDGAKQSV